VLKHASVFVVLLCAFCVPSFAQDKPPAAAASKAPVLTPEQREKVKDFQLQDAQWALQIMNSQNQQKENQEAATAFIQSLCKSSDGKTYQVHFPDLNCVAAPASSPPSGK
jgi:hypothetical protein